MDDKIRDLIASQLRNWLPTVIQSVILLVLGAVKLTPNLENVEKLSGELTFAIVGVVVLVVNALYRSGVRLLEEKYPRIGWLLLMRRPDLSTKNQS